jgi:hypothetical protein
MSMMIKRILLALAILLVADPAIRSQPSEPTVRIEQITRGPDYHHFYGYIGHVGNTPWNRSGRYMIALRTTFDDHMPEPHEAADIVLLDTASGYDVEVIDRTLAWNPQQGTMLYWNPEHPDTQLFFNDRDPETQKVFTVLYDVEQRKRLKEYRYEDTPIGNGGVAQGGGWFLAINYGRLSRLRAVTGYNKAFDWTKGMHHPEDDGIFRINVASGEKQLIVSFAQLAQALRPTHPGVDDAALFINHTLWNRDGDRIYFFARGGWGRWGTRGERINAPFTVNPDGSDLRFHKLHIGGHPEWGMGHQMLGEVEGRQVIYDTDQKKVVGTIGTEEIIPEPEGDIALSRDGSWLVNGWGDRENNQYVLYRLEDGAYVKTPPYSRRGRARGDLRQDQGPCWSPDGSKVYFPAFADDGTRQMFVVHLKEN